MNILNKIMIVICLPIFIFAEVQRAPGQPLARPKKHKMEQKGSGQNTMTVRSNPYNNMACTVMKITGVI